MRNQAPLEVAAELPDTGEGRQALARQVAELHADWVLDTLSRMTCPARQKQELLQKVMDAVRDDGARAASPAPKDSG